MEHERKAIGIEQFLGLLAGMYKLFIFGQYINFVSKAKWIKSRYLFEDYNKTTDNEISPATPFENSESGESDSQQITYKTKNMTKVNRILDLTKINLTWLYFRNKSILRFFCICF